VKSVFSDYVDRDSAAWFSFTEAECDPRVDKDADYGFQEKLRYLRDYQLRYWWGKIEREGRPKG